MKKHWFIFLLLLFGVNRLPGQNHTGNLETYLNALIELIPGSSGDLYSAPDSGELDDWKNMISDVLSDHIEEAREIANLLNYRITDFEDNTSTPSTWYYVVVEKNPQTHYWGTYVVNREPSRPGLVIQAPHTVYDLNTGYQGVYCFRRLGALALFFSGTHRCNHSGFSDCSGSTTVCNGTSEPYRISDNAHNTNSVFQAGTQVLFDEAPDTTVFVQLHGFSKLSGDPYVIMSNGTRITPELDYIEILKNELFNEDNSLTFKVIHMDLEWSRLTAFTNTQGRYINGSSDPCTEDATQCSGRFIHIEQERTKLRADSTGWYTMYKALERTFPARSDPSGKFSQSPHSSIHLYPNPVSEILRIEAHAPFSYSLYSCTGHCLLESQAGGNRADLDLSTFAPGIYMIRVLDFNGIHNEKIIIQ